MIIKANTYDIVIEKGSLKKAAEYFDLGRKTAIVTDKGVPSEYALTVLKQCGEGSFIFSAEQGEGSKSFDTLQELLKDMLLHGFTRKSCVVAVGGGVPGDLAGFAASIYMRGIDFYNIPTTVLSQVDSSVGGKTAVNFEGLKNIIGTFNQPKKVLIDSNVLATLPLRQINSGLAEAVKESLTGDAELFEKFENENPYEIIDEIIERALRYKIAVVSEDEKEAGLRKVLNFGHTIGHGIESQGGENPLTHGECVAIGMIPMCSEKTRERLYAVLKKLNLPAEFRGDSEKVFAAVLHDKKMNSGTITVSFVDEPGSFRFEEVSPDSLREKIKSVVKETE